MNKLAGLLLFLPLACIAQVDLPPSRTNSQWLNASLLQVGYVPLARLGTNSPSDGDTIIVTGNRLKFLSAGSATSLASGGGLYDVINFINVANSITNTLSYSLASASWRFSGAFTATGMTSTNAYTNLAATASTVAVWDSRKAISSLANAGGLLANDGTGVMAYVPTNSITNITILASVDIPMGAWFTNGVDSSIASTITPAQFASVTNTGDGAIMAHTNGTSAVTNAIRTRFSLPWDWDGGTVKVGLFSVCSGTNSSVATNIVYAVRAVSMSAADNLTNLTFGSFVRVTNNVGTNAWVMGKEGITSALTVGNTPGPTKGILWEIQRHGADGGDTETNANLFLSQVRVYYKRTTRADFPASSP